MIDFEAIHNKLNQISLIDEVAWDALSRLLEPVSLKKNEYLVREGQRAYHCYLLEEGVVRVFYSMDGNDYNKTFFIPGMFPTPLTALLSNEPSQLNFQCLLDSELVRFSYSGFRELFTEHKCLESLMLAILEQEWINKERHDIQMVVNDATTNYQIFRKTYPGLEALIPQYHIASFLGITPIQLSRIRSQILKS